jgi:creatinine amidohydrolase
MAAHPRIKEWKLMTGADFAALDPARCVVMVSCSPLEVHGPHLPVMCDNAEAEGMSVRTMELLADRHPTLTFLRFPPVFVATDVLPHRGSVSFRVSTIIDVLTDLGTSLSTQGFKDVWVTNFHGGPRHFVAIEKACDNVNKRHGARMVPVFSLLLTRLTGGGTSLDEVLGPLADFPAELLQGDAHGGAVETSMVLHLHGEHVGPYQHLPQNTPELELARGGAPPLQKGPRPTLLELLRGFPIKYRFFERSTYAGAPGVASAEVGRRFVEKLAELTADALDEVLNGRIRPDQCHSPLWPVHRLMLSRRVGGVVDRLMATRPRGV